MQFGKNLCGIIIPYVRLLPRKTYKKFIQPERQISIQAIAQQVGVIYQLSSLFLYGPSTRGRTAAGIPI